MFVELHILQNLSPSNLNRDDLGAPKDTDFGGRKRARVSSQCWKRRVRQVLADQALLPEANLAVRTIRLVGELTDRLEAKGRPRDTADGVIRAALGGLGLTADQKSGKTGYLLFLGKQEIERVASLCDQHWDELGDAAGATPSTNGTVKEKKKAGKGAISVPVVKALKDALDGGKACDLAMFGRMVADQSGLNIHAACQVAHAFSTNQLAGDSDFYTAVDDLLGPDEMGAVMMGAIGFNSSTFYRYASVDITLLHDNLQGDQELVREALSAFIGTFVTAIPTGHQNGFAANNLPSFVFAVARESEQWSLANAFIRPVRPTHDRDLMQMSVAALDAYWGRMVRMYGGQGAIGSWLAMLDDDTLPHLEHARVDSLDDVIRGVVSAVRFTPSRQIVSVV